MVVKNCDFESDTIGVPPVPGDCDSGYNILVPKDWSVSGIGFQIASDSFNFGGGNAPSGSYYFGLQNVGSSLYQDITLENHGHFLVSFKASYGTGDCDSSPYGSAQMKVYFGGDVLLVATAPPTWETFSFIISLSKNDVNIPQQLKFENADCNGGGDGCALFIDKISVTSAPTPSPTLRPTQEQRTVWVSKCKPTVT